MSLYTVYAVANLFAINNAVFRDIFLSYPLYAQNRFIIFFINVNQLLQARHVRIDNVVAQQYGKGLIADK
jgi:tRNA isopentenyl-2-thiomethyl-A-37 hydroxylase MiaE